MPNLIIIGVVIVIIIIAIVVSITLKKRKIEKKLKGKKFAFVEKERKEKKDFEHTTRRTYRVRDFLREYLKMMPVALEKNPDVVLEWRIIIPNDMDARFKLKEGEKGILITITAGSRKAYVCKKFRETPGSVAQIFVPKFFPDLPEKIAKLF